MFRPGFLRREWPLAVVIACVAVPAAIMASGVLAADSSAGKSTGSGGYGDSGGAGGKDGDSRSDGQATRQNRSLYTFERGLNGELIVRDASGRRVGTGTRDDLTTLRTQDR